MGEQSFEIFLVAIPGLEPWLLAEARERGFASARPVAGGVTFLGTWADVWRANLELRGASRVLVRIGSFYANHLAQLDKRARAFPWGNFLRKDVAVAVEATCRKSKIYHSGAAAQRVATAIREEFGAVVSDAAPVTLKVRIEDDLVTLSLDTSGGLLHKRGSKQAMAKAPMRETMAALLLRACGYAGREPVYDPFCGSGTFVIEAAEIATGLAAGRHRSFAFEHLPGFDAATWQALRNRPPVPMSDFICHGSDRDAGAVKSATANAERAGVAASTRFTCKTLSDAMPPEGPPGLVIMNPPYGTRIGEAKKLEALYVTIGKVMRERFAGWRVGLITSNTALARATGLPFASKSPPILHGGLKVHLFQTGAI